MVLYYTVMDVNTKKTCLTAIEWSTDRQRLSGPTVLFMVLKYSVLLCSVGDSERSYASYPRPTYNLSHLLLSLPFLGCSRYSTVTLMRSASLYCTVALGEGKGK